MNQMTGKQISILPGMRDFDAREYQTIVGITTKLVNHIGSHGYSTIDTPMMEETELFLRKSGGELTERLYSFTDPGGHAVSLRPEFTSSVIRFFIDNQNILGTPSRLLYQGPVFRYEPAGNYRQFNQVGAEFIGEVDIEADAEILSIALSGVRDIGISDGRIQIGHLGILHTLLDSFGLSEASRWFMIGNIQAIKTKALSNADLEQKAINIGLLRQSSDVKFVSSIESMSQEEAEEFILGIMKEFMPAQVGRRSTGQIITRMLKKTQQNDSPKAFREALNLLSELSTLEGDCEKIIASAREIVKKTGLDDSPFDIVEDLITRLKSSQFQNETLMLDLGLARGITYYTGMIFELATLSRPDTSLGGGGRYDELIKSLGGPRDVPALGFAYNVDNISSILNSYNE